MGITHFFNAHAAGRRGKKIGVGKRGDVTTGLRAHRRVMRATTADDKDQVGPKI